MIKRGVLIFFVIILIINGCGQQRGTLEVTVTSGEKAEPGAEVWVWEEKNFGGNPDYVQQTGQDGKTLFHLKEGIHVISLSPPKYYPTDEDTSKNVIYAEIKPGETTSKTLKLPEGTADTTTAGTQLSEQPDQQKYAEYLTDLGLGSVKQGMKLPEGLEENVKTFKAGEQACIYGNLIKETTMQSSIYNTTAKKEVQPKGGPQQTMSKGGFAGCSSVNLPAGKYEYKVYIGEALVGVFPFEVS
jgi:hypothetical protein